jgi:hypothetical protein
MVRGAVHCAALLAALVLPAAAGALEPRFDHRDQQGPSVEALFARDFTWSGSASTKSALREAVRVAWGFDPTGDGDEILLGVAISTFVGPSIDDDRVRLAFDARYRVYVGSEEFKTLFDFGLWGSARDQFLVGPLAGVGVEYDFNRNIGLFTNVFIAAAVGDGRIVSFGGGLGFQYRFE